MRVALLLLALLLAGCAEGPVDEVADVPEPAADEPERPALHGWVVDQTIRPLKGVTVEVLESDATASTDAEGFYGFEGLDHGQPLILIASLEGYETQSRQVTLHPDVPVRLNFTLEEIPEAVPYMELQSFNGLLTCQTGLVVQENEQVTDCSGGESGDIWEFAVGPQLAGLVLEVAWDATTPLSGSMKATLETLGLGDSNQLLAEAIGTSIVRLQVPEAVAQTLYPAGGQMRLTVAVLPNTDENETGVGAGAAVNQEFQAFASAFYIEPPPTTYSVAG